MSGFDHLQTEVIGTGLCTFCGICVGVCPSRVVSMDYDLEEPRRTEPCPPRCALCQESCAGRDIPMPQLERMHFGRERNPNQEPLGICLEFRRGQSTEKKVRIGGASGGFVSGLLIYLLEQGLIDGAVVAAMSEEQPWRAVPRIATNKEEVVAAGQSKLAVVPNNAVLSEALARGMTRLAVVGLPCHVHSIRKLQMAGKAKKLANSIQYVIGLFCGSNWTYRATEHVIEEVCGLSLEEVAKLEYRGGEYPGDFTVTARDGRVMAVSSASRRNHTRGFRRYRCSLCMDYSSELADISVGDYIHPEMVRGAPGWSASIIRTEKGKELVEDAQTSDYVTTEAIDKDYFLMGGYEKVHYSSYLIEERQRHGAAVPDFHMPLVPGPLRRRLSYDHPHWS